MVAVKVSWTLCTVLLVVICFLFVNIQNTLAAQEDEDDIPITKLSQNVGAPTLKFLYCYSCGYRKMFDQYTEIIQQKYPYILVDGGNYDPPGMNMFLSRLLGVMKMLIIVCIFGNVNIFEYINQPRPSWWTWCTENRVYASLMLFFLSNLLEGQLIQSGAFEIMLNDVPIWSKLETGRIPQPAELFQIIDSQMQFKQVEFQNSFA